MNDWSILLDCGKVVWHEFVIGSTSVLPSTGVSLFASLIGSYVCRKDMRAFAETPKQEREHFVFTSEQYVIRHYVSRCRDEMCDLQEGNRRVHPKQKAALALEQIN